MIYFIQGKEGTPIKIGYSADAERLERRISTIQTSYPYRLKLIASIDPGPIALEKEIHKILASDRLNGEWFEAHPRAETFAKCISAFPRYEDGLAHYRTISEEFVGLIGKEAGLVAETSLGAIFKIPAAEFAEYRRARNMPARCIAIQHGRQIQRYYPVADAIEWARSLSRPVGKPALWTLRNFSIPAEKLRSRNVVSGAIVADGPPQE